MVKPCAGSSVPYHHHFTICSNTSVRCSCSLLFYLYSTNTTSSTTASCTRSAHKSQEFCSRHLAPTDLAPTDSCSKQEPQLLLPRPASVTCLNPCSCCLSLPIPPWNFPPGASSAKSFWEFHGRSPAHTASFTWLFYMSVGNPSSGLYTFMASTLLTEAAPALGPRL